MATFTFSGAEGTFLVFSGGVITSGNPGVPTVFNASVGKGVGISVTKFRFVAECGQNCNQTQPGDTIKVKATTLLFASKVRIEYSLCGGQCRGTITEWYPGIGLGISGELKFKY